MSKKLIIFGKEVEEPYYVNQNSPSYTYVQYCPESTEGYDIELRVHGHGNTDEECLEDLKKNEVKLWNDLKELMGKSCLINKK